MNNPTNLDVIVELSRVDDAPEAGENSKKCRNRVKCEEVSFTCHYCDKLYFEKKELRSHIARHMKNDNKLKCEVCNIGFSRRSYLAEHVNIHNGQKPFSCYYCGKLFSLRCNLVRHTRIHTGEKRFPCDQCDKKFILKKNLIEHQRTHTGEKPFKCKTCDRLFGRRSSLVRHVRTHTGEKKYVCNICNKTFAWKYYLQRHMPIHLRGRRRRRAAEPKVVNVNIYMQNALQEMMSPEEYEILTTKELVVVCDRV
ncbi:gastrula zinc finger protein XlCGF8.2DB-like isoform X1 [Planococcus citri]|uniref:gastrula zinc finger protein XlCGF8.2DB-like isoform X1 n=2 Tax=Planococcus citri TaxID=170843 RepID=UPI0031F9C20E